MLGESGTEAFDGEASGAYKGEEQPVIDESSYVYSILRVTLEIVALWKGERWRKCAGCAEPVREAWKPKIGVLYLVLRREDGGGRNRRKYFERH